MPIHCHGNYCKTQFENLTFSQMTFRESSCLNRTTTLIHQNCLTKFSIDNMHIQQNAILMKELLDKNGL